MATPEDPSALYAAIIDQVTYEPPSVDEIIETIRDPRYTILQDSISINSPFVITACAPRFQGKTYLTVNFLKEHPYMKNISYVYICSLSVNLNRDYDEFRDEEEYYFYGDDEINVRLISDIIEKQSECKKAVIERERAREDNPALPKLKCPEALLILDDCLDAGVLQFGGVIESIAERGRHFNLSMIICSQRITGISRSVRINSNFFIVFGCNNSEEERFVDDFIGRSDRKAVYTLIKKLAPLHYTFFFVDTFERNKLKRLKVSTSDMFIKGECVTVQMVVIDDDVKKKIRVLSD